MEELDLGYLWNCEGWAIFGKKNGFEFSGKIKTIRTKYGDDLSVIVDVDKNLENVGAILVINGSTVVRGSDGVFSDLYLLHPDVTED